MSTPGTISALLSSYQDHCGKHSLNDTFKLVDSKLLDVPPSLLILQVHSIKWFGTHGKIRLFRICLSDGVSLVNAHPPTLPPFRQKVYRQIQHGGKSPITVGKFIGLQSFDLCHRQDPALSIVTPTLVLKKVTVLK